MAAKRSGKPAPATLTRSTVMDLAGPAAFARGMGYYADGRVELRGSNRGRFRALVRGTMPYEVDLWEVRGAPAWSCSCPVGEGGDFCKHCVAVALELLADTAAASPARSTPRDDAPDLREHLRGLDPDELVDLVLEQAQDDWRLRERLTAQAAASAGRTIDLAAWRKRVDAAFRTGSFVSYSEAGGWAQGVEEMLDALADLVDAGHADAVVTLAERSHRRAEKAMGHIDDSDGWLGGISSRVADLHLRACEAAQPDPVELARRLVDLELHAELDTFHRAAARYASVLGATGLAEYRARVEPQWRALKPRDDDYRTERFRIEQGMIGLALGTGDPDLLVTVVRERLRSPADHLEIAEALARAGRTEEAIAWARDGLATFADRHRQTPPLRDFLAGLLRDAGDGDGALALFWTAFESLPTLDAYRRLLREAEACGEVEQSRQRALAALRTRVAQARVGQEVLASMLVEILLYEGDDDAAWQTASEHGCGDHLWLMLARAREKDHPLDVIPIYEREAERQIGTKNNHGYRAAVKLLDRTRTLYASAGHPERFAELVAGVRQRHKPKRNLMALLEQRGW